MGGLMWTPTPTVPSAPDAFGFQDGKTGASGVRA